MAALIKTPRSRLILAAIVAACALTIGLRLSGLLGTAGQVVAYATALLAAGTIGLAIGTIGLFTEQRRTSRRQEAELSTRRAADVAQVEIERLSGPGEMLRINVRNGSQRAITNVYVWADVRGVTGHYAAGAPAGDAQSRRMANVPHDGDLYWQLRVIGPGRQAFFVQLTHMNPQPLAAMADAEITAFAEFTDADGTWWRCDEDGNVSRPQPASQPTPGPGRAVLRELTAAPVPSVWPSQPSSQATPVPARRGQLKAGHAAPRLTRFAGRAVQPRSRHYSDVP